MEWIISSIWGIAVCSLISILIYINCPRQIIHKSDRNDGWFSIIEHPIPDDLRRFIVTDGKEVSNIYESKYNRFGKPVMGDKIITHWMPYPNPPKEGKK